MAAAGEPEERDAVAGRWRRQELDGSDGRAQRIKARDEVDAETYERTSQADARSATQSREALPPRVYGVPRGIRTPVPAVKGRCPGPG